MLGPMRWLAIALMLVALSPVRASAQGERGEEVQPRPVRVIPVPSAPPRIHHLAAWADRETTPDVRCRGPRAAPRCTLHLVLVFDGPVEGPLRDLEIAIHPEGQPDRARRLAPAVRTTEGGSEAQRWSGALRGVHTDVRYFVMVRRRSGEVLARTVIRPSWDPPLPAHGCRGWSSEAEAACRAGPGQCSLGPPLHCSGVRMSEEMLEELRREQAQQPCQCTCARERMECARVP